MYNDISIVLDFKKSNVFPIIEFVQGDSKHNRLNITVNDNGVPVNFTNMTAEMYYLKANKKYLVQKDNLNIIDATLGKLQVVITDSALTYAGIVKCELSFHDNLNGRLTTTLFSFKVRSSIISEGILEGTE